jgi:hypothetical protein
MADQRTVPEFAIYNPPSPASYVVGDELKEWQNSREVNDHFLDKPFFAKHRSDTATEELSSLSRDRVLQPRHASQSRVNPETQSRTRT